MNELSIVPPRLPLALVDWYSEQAKFDDGPCVTTVLGLDWIVSRVLDTKPLRDFTDYVAVKRQIGKLQQQLGVSLQSAVGRVEELESVKLSPFVYRDEELVTIGGAFRDVWAGPLVNLLTQFSPYAALLSRRIEDHTLSLDFQNWYRLRKRHQSDQFAGKATDEYRQFLGRLAARESGPLGEQVLLEQLEKIERLKSGNLAFNVVFQRALVESLLEYCKIGTDAVDELSDFGAEEIAYPIFEDDDDYDQAVDDEAALELASDDEPIPEALTEESELKIRIAARSNEFIMNLNRLLADYPDLLSIDCTFQDPDGETGFFWQGTLRKPEGGIDFTQGASTRAKDLIFMAAAMLLYDDRTDPAEGSSFEDFWDLTTSGEGPSLCRRLGRAIKRFSNDENSAAGRILKAQKEYQYFDADEAIEECLFRLRSLWIAAKL